MEDIDDHSGDAENVNEKDDGDIDDSYQNYFNNLETEADARLGSKIDFYSDHPELLDGDEEPPPQPTYYKALYKSYKGYDDDI